MKSWFWRGYDALCKFCVSVQMGAVRSRMRLVVWTLSLATAAAFVLALTGHCLCVSAACARALGTVAGGVGTLAATGIVAAITMRHKLATRVGEDIAKAECGCQLPLAVLAIGCFATGSLLTWPPGTIGAQTLTVLGSSSVWLVAGTGLVFIVHVARLAGLGSTRTLLGILASRCTLESAEDCLDRMQTVGRQAMDTCGSATAKVVIRTVFNALSRSADHLLHAETFLGEAATVERRLPGL